MTKGRDTKREYDGGEVRRKEMEEEEEREERDEDLFSPPKCLAPFSANSYV